MITNINNFKYLLLLSFFFIFPKNNKADVHADLTAHGGYTFETNKGQMVTAVYLSFFNNSEVDLEIKSFSTDKKVGTTNSRRFSAIRDSVFTITPLRPIFVAIAVIALFC